MTIYEKVTVLMKTGGASLLKLSIAFAFVMLMHPLSASADLIGHWTFDEGSGTNAVDSSSNSNTATYAAATWDGAGVSGSAVVNPKFSLADSSDLVLTGQVAFSISLWVKTAAEGTYRCLAGFEGTGNTGDRYAIKVDTDSGPDGTIRLTPGTDIYTPSTIAAYCNSGSDWAHIVGVNEPGVNSRIYVNGSVVDTGSVLSIPDPASAVFTMGTYWNSGSYDYSGLLDDVQVYDNALTDDAVTWMYNNPGSSYPPPARGTVFIFQ